MEDRWVVVKTFLKSHEAMLAKGLLVSCGIKARFQSSVAGSGRMTRSLLVLEKDVKNAMDLLEER